MEPFLFFLFGLPVAFAANYLIMRLTDLEEDDEAEIDAETKGRLAAKRLPWHLGPWPVRVRLLSVASIPALTAVAGWRFDVAQAVAVSLLVVALIVCTATDLLRYRVPNAVTYPGVVLALAAALLMPGADFVTALVAAGLGGFVFLLMAIITRGGMGLGDVKLAVLIGAGLGLPAAYQALALGVIVGGLVILVLFLAGVVGRRQAVPYAPFLALTAVAVVLMQGAAFAPL
jgi:prepilin signal peptidase PulO-like enzyme (type II secretory pathway)